MLLAGWLAGCSGEPLVFLCRRGAHTVGGREGGFSASEPYELRTKSSPPATDDTDLVLDEPINCDGPPRHEYKGFKRVDGEDCRPD